MVWDGKNVRVPAATRLAAVTALHLAILAWMLTAKIIIPTRAPTVISLELAELQPLQPTPAPAPDPAPLPGPRPEAPVDTRSTAPSPAPVTRERPAVLTQNEPAAAPEAEPARAPPMAPPDAAPVTPEQIAGLLRQLDCQKATRRRPEPCPDTDAFTAWATKADRATVARNADGGRSYRSKTMIDQVYEQDVRGRLHWPDEALFADPMAPGAFNAERIRRGQEPLWSQETRDGFRKPDD